MEILAGSDVSVPDDVWLFHQGAVSSGRVLVGVVTNVCHVTRVPAGVHSLLLPVSQRWPHRQARKVGHRLS